MSTHNPKLKHTYFIQLITALTIITALFMTNLTTVKANDTDEFNLLANGATPPIVALNKVWKIEFVKPILSEPNLSYKIYIKDDLSNFIFPTVPELDYTGRIIYLKHEIPFQSGRSYTMYINKNVKDKDGRIFMDTNYMMKFDADPKEIIEQLKSIYAIDEQTLINRKYELKNWVDVERECYLKKAEQINKEQNLEGFHRIIKETGQNPTPASYGDNRYLKEGYRLDDVTRAAYISAMSGVEYDKVIKAKGKEPRYIFDGIKHVDINSEQWDKAFKELNIDIESIIRRRGMPQDHINYFRFRSVTYNDILNMTPFFHERFYNYLRLPVVTQHMKDLNNMILSEREKIQQFRNEQ